MSIAILNLPIHFRESVYMFGDVGSFRTWKRSSPSRAKRTTGFSAAGCLRRVAQEGQGEGQGQGEEVCEEEESG